MKINKNFRIWPPSYWPAVGRFFRRMAPPPVWIRGRFDLAWEVSCFHPDGSTEWWWTSLMKSWALRFKAAFEAA